MKQYGLNGSYYNEEMSSVKTLDLLPRYYYTCLRLRLVGHIPKWESLGITQNHSRPFGWSKTCVRLVTFNMIPEWESLRMILFGE